MLDSLRKAAGTWVAKLLLVLLVLSFAVWGISGQFLGGAGNNVLTVGGTNVSINEYRLSYDRQLSVLSQQFGTRLTREQATALGIDNQVLAQLVAGAVLDEQASEMNLGLSRDRLAQLTVEDPAFQGPDGRFNRQQFDYVLRQVGMRPEDYLTNRQQVAIRQQIVEAVSDGMKTPDAYLNAFSLYRGEDRTLEYVVIPRSTVEPIDEPTDDQVKTFFEARKADYAAPEYRKISYVKLEPSDIADEGAITDEAVQDYYDKNVARYTTPEKRTIEQLVFASEDAAKAAREKVAAGSTFEEVVAAEGKTMRDVALGTFEKERVADPAIAEAAFSLPQGEVSQPVRGSFGHLLVRVTAITPAIVRPLTEVQNEIRRDLAVDEASRVLLDVHDSYEDARAGGETMQEAASRLRLRVVTVDAVDRQGRAPDGSEVSLPEAQALLREAFESDVSVENAPVQIGSAGFLFFEVEGITPARDRTVDEIRDRVAADWKNQEAASRLAARAEELRKQLADGKSFADIATELGVEVQTKRGVKRGAEDVDLGRAGISAAFGVAQGGTGLVAAPADGAQILFKVTEVFAPVSAGPDAVPEQTRQALASGMADDLLDQMVAKLQAQYGVTVNRTAITQALSF